MQLNKSGELMRMRGFCNLSAPTDVAFILSKSPHKVVSSFENHLCSWTNLVPSCVWEASATFQLQRYALWKRYALRYALLKTIHTTIRTFENDTHWRYALWKRYALRYALWKTIHTTIRTLKNDTHSVFQTIRTFENDTHYDTHFWKRYTLRYALLKTMHTPWFWTTQKCASIRGALVTTVRSPLPGDPPLGGGGGK